MQHKLLDQFGEPISTKSVYGLDKDFWVPMPGGVVRTTDVENRPYLYHPWIYGCARVISFNLCRLQRRMVDIENQSKALENSETLALLKRPNTIMTERTFFQTIVLLLLVGTGTGTRKSGGQVFIVPWNSKTGQKVNLKKGEIPTELIPFDGHYFEPVQEAQSNGMKALTGWKMAPYSTQTMVFSTEEIIRIYFVNPYDPLGGIAPLFPAQIALLQDISSDVYNTQIFLNDGRVAGILSSDQFIPDDQARAYKKRWVEEYGGAGNNNKLAVLGGALKYQQFGLTQADMQWIEQKKWSKDQFIATFGLNKIAVGDYEQINFATIKEGRKLLWHDTYIPIDEIILDALNNQWVCYGPEKNYQIASDYSKVQALQSDYNEASNAAGRMVQQMGFPPELAAKLNNIPLSEEDLKRWPFLSEQVVPPAPQAFAMVNEKPIESKTIVVESNKLTRENRVKFWHEYVEKVFKPNEKAFAEDVRRFFFSQRNRMLDKIDAWIDQHKGLSLVEITKEQTPKPILFMLDDAKEEDAFMRMYTPAAMKQMQAEKVQLQKELGQMINWDATEPRLEKYISRRKADLDGIQSTTKKEIYHQIDDVVQQGLKDGLTPKEMAQAIKEGVSEVMNSRADRAMMIARTEMNTISSMSRFDAFREEGIEQQEWITTMDGKQRDSHDALDGQTTKVGDPFPGTNMKYPRDPVGGAEECINCRCVAVASFEGENE